ncbi:MAG: hypothetical protein RJA83_617 [Pseudomonadota bacterium]|jgi:hypothetical protein
MPIVTELGIHTAELCPDNKKYLSRLLVGKTGINSSCITWDLLLTEKLTLDTFVETGEENLAELMEARAEWNRLLKGNKLKAAIENKLAAIETAYLPERLKPYDPEVRSKQEESRHKNRVWVSIFLIIVLPIAFYLALPYLAGAAILVGVASLGVGAALLSYSISAFIGKRLPHPEWYKEQPIETEKWQKKISEIIIEKAEEPLSNKQISQLSNVKQTEPLMVEAATQTIPDDSVNDKSSRICHISFFKQEKQLLDSDHQTILPQCITS